MNLNGIRVTGRELEVWRLVALGRSTKEIAAELGIAPKTVEKHREKVYLKIGGGANHVVALVHKAVRHGVITIEVLP